MRRTEEQKEVGTNTVEVTEAPVLCIVNESKRSPPKLPEIRPPPLPGIVAPVVEVKAPAAVEEPRSSAKSHSRKIPAGVRPDRIYKLAPPPEKGRNTVAASKPVVEGGEAGTTETSRESSESDDTSEMGDGNEAGETDEMAEAMVREGQYYGQCKALYQRVRYLMADMPPAAREERTWEQWHAELSEYIVNYDIDQLCWDWTKKTVPAAAEFTSVMLGAHVSPEKFRQKMDLHERPIRNLLLVLRQKWTPEIRKHVTIEMQLLGTFGMIMWESMDDMPPVSSPNGLTGGTEPPRSQPTDDGRNIDSKSIGLGGQESDLRTERMAETTEVRPKGTGGIEGRVA